LENAKGGVLETVVAGELGDAAEVAFEHVGFAHGGGIRLEGGGEGFFEETLLEADAEVAGENFDEELRGDGRDGGEEVFEEGGFRGGAFGCAEGVEERFDFGEGGVGISAGVGHGGFGGEAGVVDSTGEGTVFRLGQAGGFD
jgi:hypothetical protein